MSTCSDVMLFVLPQSLPFLLLHFDQLALGNNDTRICPNVVTALL